VTPHEYLRQLEARIIDVEPDDRGGERRAGGDREYAGPVIDAEGAVDDEVVAGK
jgi:hypothetical protein